MSTPACSYCSRTNYMFLSRCRACRDLFCDNCSEAAAQLADGAEFHSSKTVVMYQPVCPKCGSKNIDIGAKE